MTWKSSAFRMRVIKELHEKHSISFRRSDKGIGAVFDTIARGLRRGEVVELPGLGVLKFVRRGKVRKARFYKYLEGKKIRFKLLPARPAAEKVFRFKPDPSIDLEN